MKISFFKFAAIIKQKIIQIFRVKNFFAFFIFTKIILPLFIQFYKKQYLI